MAAPVHADCGFLLRMADMPRYLDEMIGAVGTEREATTFFAFEDSLARVDEAELADVVAFGTLAEYQAPLLAYVAALKEAARQVASDDVAAARGLAGSYGISVGENLVARLVDEYDCHSAEELSDVAYEGVSASAPVLKPAQHEVPPGGTSGDGPEGTTQDDVEQPLAIVSLTGFVAALIAAAVTLPRLLRALRKQPWRKRKHRRFSCRYQTTIECDAQSYRSLIIDVSRLGGQVSAPPSIQQGTSIRVVIGDEKLAAVVAWRGEHFAGIRFDTPLTDRHLASIAPSAGQTMPDLSAA